MAGHSTFVDPQAQVAEVVDLIAERLDLMESVAAWKYGHALPVVDATREQAVLDAAVSEAQALGMSGESARELYALQIRLARERQQRLIDRWTEERAAIRPVEDLNLELRPRLDALGRRLSRALYLALPEFEREDFVTAYASTANRLAASGLDDTDIHSLLERLGALRRAPSPALRRIAVSGILRVGTTGDYAPFTFEADSVLTGADIDAALALAAALGAEARFIRTSWPTLMDDYAHGRFDVAIRRRERHRGAGPARFVFGAVSSRRQDPNRPMRQGGAFRYDRGNRSAERRRDREPGRHE